MPAARSFRKGHGSEHEYNSGMNGIPAGTRHRDEQATETGNTPHVETGKMSLPSVVIYRIL
jgi:hypothetical protein